MNLLVTAPTCWPTEEIVTQKIWLYRASCEKYGIHPEFYGLGATRYEGSGYIRMDGHLNYLKQHAGGYTHVLFTDAWDLLFLAPLEAIVAKYIAFGSPPMLMSATWCLNDYTIYAPDDVDPSTPYKFPGSAMYIAEIPYLIDTFTRMDRVKKEDESYAYSKAWREGWFRPVLDSKCELFQDNEKYCIVENGRVYNALTGTYPLIVHFGGDYTDPDTGKDVRIIPWAKQLGIIP